MSRPSTPLSWPQGGDVHARQKAGHDDEETGRTSMPRVALVTGGTRGIGAAIAKSLNAAGYNVAANYGGNQPAAPKVKAETGIPVYKWDVSSFEACAAGVKQVEADLGPIEVLANNAGITRDGAFHKMTIEQWNAVINTNLGSLFNVTRQVIEG